MKVVLDEKTCLAKNLTLQEALIAAAMNMPNFNETFHNMIHRGIIDSSGSKLEDKWVKVLNTMLNFDEDHLRKLAQQMKECYPKGKKPGTVFYFRCNEKEIMMKLKKFFENNGEYSDEQIIKATKKFVASYHGDYKLMPLIKYFISKNKTVMDENGENHIVEVSELASTLENMEDNENIPEIEDSEDWLMNSKN